MRESLEYTKPQRTLTRSRMRVGTAAMAFATLVTVAACGGAKDDASALKTDTTLGRDLAMAAADSATPKLQDAPAAAPLPDTNAPVATAPKAKPTPKPSKTPATKPATAAPAPAPAPTPAKPTTGSIAAGTAMRFETNGKVCSNTTPTGEKFTAKLADAITGSNGIVIPAGATGTFEVAESHTAKNNGDTTYMKVRLIAVQYNGDSYPVDATVQSAAMTKVRSSTTGNDAKKVAGGAVVGAIAGRIIGKSTKGAVIGAAAGAAAGGVAAAQTADFNTCLNEGAAIAVKLDKDATIKISN